MQISPLNTGVNASQIPIENLAADKRLSEAQKIGEVARQFEAVLLRQILSEAQKKIFHSTADPDSMAGGIYRDMMTDQLAEKISSSGSFGLARVLERQLKQELKLETPSADGTQKL